MFYTKSEDKMPSLKTKKTWKGMKVSTYQVGGMKLRNAKTPRDPGCSWSSHKTVVYNLRHICHPQMMPGNNWGHFFWSQLESCSWHLRVGTVVEAAMHSTIPTVINPAPSTQLLVSQVWKAVWWGCSGDSCSLESMLPSPPSHCLPVTSFCSGFPEL